MDTRARPGAGDIRMTTLRFYSVFGERLASELPLPELDEIPAGPARWTVSVATTLPPIEGAVELGAECIYGDVHARLLRHAHGHRIIVEDTGTFDLSEDRTRITIVPLAGAWDDFVRAHLTGRVLATALHLDGLLPVHGSAVATADGVIGFLAPKGYGKSSLALALTAAGAWLVSDDTLALDAESGRAWPGVHGLRVREDARGVVGVPEGAFRTREGKHLITEFGQERVFARPMALAALYLLVPIDPDGEGVDRAPMPQLQGAISLVAHVKIGGMLGAAAAPVLLARAARLVATVPLYQLAMPRDLDALPAMARTILEWHGVPTP